MVDIGREAIKTILFVLFVMVCIAVMFISVSNSIVLQAELDKATKCYREYRAIDQGIEKCIEQYPERATECLGAWQYKTFINSNMGCNEYSQQQNGTAG